MIEDGAVDRGSVTTIRRVGETIHRPVREWTPAVHALLTHLETVGFRRAPRALGIEDREEVLSLLHGEPAFKPWPPALLAPSGVVELGRWLREYHDSVRDFRPTPGSRWQLQAEDEEWRPGMVIRHGDLGPWNSIWLDGRLTGFIDWDFAAPGHAVDDLAQLAWYTVPLRPAEPERNPGVTGPAMLRERLTTLCSAYEAEPRDVLNALEGLQEREAGRIQALGVRGIEPWRTFLDRGDVTEMRDEGRWLQEHRGPLLDRA